MNNILLLLNISIFNIFGLNKLKDKDAKNNVRSIVIAISILYAMGILCYGLYNTADTLAQNLSQIGNYDFILMIAFISSTVMVLIMTIMNAQGILFSSRDFDLLNSLPIKTSHILLSKFFVLLIFNYLIILFTFIPFIIVYLQHIDFNIITSINVIINFILIPIIPIIFASILAFLVSFVASRFRKQNLLLIILSFAILIFATYLSFKMNEFIPMLIINSKEIMDKINLYYPYLPLYYKSINSNDILSMIILIMLNIIPLYLFIIIFKIGYKKIIARLNEIPKAKEYRFKSLKNRSPLITLFIKDIKRYFSSFIYVLNTSFGLVILTVLSIATIFVDISDILKLLELPSVNELIPAVVTLLIVCCLVLSVTTNISISIEGMNLWIIKSLPVTPMQIFMSKIMSNLVLLIPALIVNLCILTITIGLSFESFIVTLIIGILASLAVSSGGLIINLMFPNLTWTSETQIVKQSLSSFLGILYGMIIVFIPVYLYLNLNISNINLYLWLVILGLSILVVISYYVLRLYGIKKFKSL